MASANSADSLAVFGAARTFWSAAVTSAVVAVAASANVLAVVAVAGSFANFPVVGLGTYCPPRHPAHEEALFIESMVS
jgi:hypothetical protein